MGRESPAGRAVRAFALLETSMKTLFGLRIFPEPDKSTDDEFVIRTREILMKYEGSRKWLIGLHIVYALLTIVAIGYVVQGVAGMWGFLQGVPGAQEVWFLLGLAIGWFAGHQLTHAVRSFMDIVGETTDLRSKRLLIQYYDACHPTDSGEMGRYAEPQSACRESSPGGPKERSGGLCSSPS